ncbi:hypothetical protein [Budvicia diplopodorum]|uniref:hypothetical protein n=1 Tax=Budvicia diplopodorum TaxID=1119056 RepID=UPI00135B000E|nr:hypothetical protein [Budvicia diplopodorum]
MKAPNNHRKSMGDALTNGRSGEYEALTQFCDIVTRGVFNANNAQASRLEV